MSHDKRHHLLSCRSALSVNHLHYKTRSPLDPPRSAISLGKVFKVLVCFAEINVVDHREYDDITVLGLLLVQLPQQARPSGCFLADGASRIRRHTQNELGCNEGGRKVWKVDFSIANVSLNTSKRTDPFVPFCLLLRTRLGKPKLPLHLD